MRRKRVLNLEKKIINRILPKYSGFRAVLLALLAGLFVSSCIVVLEKEPETVEVRPPQYGPKSSIALGGDFVISRRGDLGLQVPEDWQSDLVPPEFESVDAFNSNPDGSLLLVLSFEGRYDGESEDLDGGNLEELALETSARRAAKGQATRTGDIESYKVQGIKFATYRTSYTGGAIESRNAITVSPSGNIYNIGLIPVNDIMNKMPPQEEIDRIFKEILNTVMM